MIDQGPIISYLKDGGEYYDVKQISEQEGGIVTIIDSGIEKEIYEQNPGRFVEVKSFLRGDDGTISSGDPWDNTGHGTLLYQIISTLNPSIKFVILKV